MISFTVALACRKRHRYFQHAAFSAAFSAVCGTVSGNAVRPSLKAEKGVYDVCYP